MLQASVDVGANYGPWSWQIHGDSGYLIENGIERARDARLGLIGGGTDQIVKEVLGRAMGL